MARCPACEYPLPYDREQLGSRCPNCHDPLYESRNLSRPIRPGEAACALHPHSEASGPCQRCGTFMCEVCRCRWRELAVCTECVDRALQTKEASPTETRTHFRQALYGLLLSLAAWILAVLSYGFAVFVGVIAGNVHPLLALLLLAAVGTGVLVALFGVGQAMSALRVRGNHMILATFGLTLGSLYLGVMIGVLAIGLWVV